jgi:hypothetical protein
MQFTQEQKKPDNRPPKDPLLEALEKTLKESRRLRGEVGEDGPAPPSEP